MFPRVTGSPLYPLHHLLVTPSCLLPLLIDTLLEGQQRPEVLLLLPVCQHGGLSLLTNTQPSANQKPGFFQPIRIRGLCHLGDVSELGEADYVTEDGGPLERVDGLVVGGQEGGDRLPGHRVVVHPVVARAQLVQEEQASLAGSWVSGSV